MSRFNNVETTFEIPVTPMELRNMADTIEHHERNAIVGQVIRVKVNHNLCFTMKVDGVKEALLPIDFPANERSLQ